MLYLFIIFVSAKKKKIQKLVANEIISRNHPLYNLVKKNKLKKTGCQKLLCIRSYLSFLS